MKRARHLRLRTRRRLSWLVAMMLLWQQVAVAAYVCAVAPAPAGAVATMVQAHSTAAMGHHCAQMPASQGDALCHQHCQPDHATQVGAYTASVPVNALAALPPTPSFATMVALPSNRFHARHDPWRERPPLPRLLFCSLLI